jgi:glycerol dehydrogenase-like iron-containing ADH family enzyme
MFTSVPTELLQRAMRPPVQYGHNILAAAVRSVSTVGGAHYTVFTLPEPWSAVQKQFTKLNRPRQVLFLRSMEYSELEALERSVPPTALVVGVGGGQALDAAKFVAWRRGLPLVLAPTIVSVDAAVTNTIAVREGQRVRYVGFVVADAIPVDLSVIARAPAALNRAGIGDLLSIHTALWDWKHSNDGYDDGVAAEASAILSELDHHADAIAGGSEVALRFIMDAFARENALCLRVGSSRPEEGSEHYLGYNLEYITRRSFVHGQLICLCTYAMARMQENRPDWVRALIERARCPWRLSELGITRDQFIQALLSLRDYAVAEGFPHTVISERAIEADFAMQLATECDTPAS